MEKVPEGFVIHHPDPIGKGWITYLLHRVSRCYTRIDDDYRWGSEVVVERAGRWVYLAKTREEAVDWMARQPIGIYDAKEKELIWEGRELRTEEEVQALLDHYQNLRHYLSPEYRLLKSLLERAKEDLNE